MAPPVALLRMLMVVPEAEAVIAEFPAFKAAANAEASEDTVLPCPKFALATIPLTVIETVPVSQEIKQGGRPVGQVAWLFSAPESVAEPCPAVPGVPPP